MAIKRFVCLGLSWKHDNLCIAGKEYFGNGQFGKWIRPITNTEGHSIPRADINFSIGSIVSCCVASQPAALFPHQTENFFLERSPNWKAEGRLPEYFYQQCADYPKSLWGEGYSSGMGFNDKVPESRIASCNNSLYFIKIKEARITNVLKGDKLQRRVLFIYNGISYNLAVTDPQLDSRYRNLAQNQILTIGSCFLTISLGEPIWGACYKLAGGYVRG